LSRDEREVIRAGLERGETYTAIAGTIGRAVSTVSRDVAANGGRDGYRAWRAHQDAGQRARRPKSPKLAHGPLVAVVTEWLEQWWSPEQITSRLRIEFPDDPMMWVSHETIYRRCSSRGEENCAVSCTAACAPAGPGAVLAAGSRPAARSPTR